jgi:hypothetical protein
MIPKPTDRDKNALAAAALITSNSVYPYALLGSTDHCVNSFPKSEMLSPVIKA